MKTRFVRQTTEDQLILQGLLYEPDKKCNRVILHIHGMAGNFYESRFLDEMAATFTNSNWAFLTVNTRGHDYIADIPKAGQKEKYKRVGSYRERFEDCIRDIKAWVDFTEKEDFKEIVLQGHSLGSVKVVYYLGKTHDKRIKRLILASPPDMVGLAEQDDKDRNRHLKIAQKMVKEGRGKELVPWVQWGWYYLSAHTYLDFSTRDKPIDVFNTYDKDKPSILKEIRVPILAFYGSKDDAAILPLQESLKIIKNKTTNCPQFDTGIIEGAPHSYFGHEKEMAEIIIRWLEARG
jgi:alpha-beta hydrolase superfamily lysophospholipase